MVKCISQTIENEAKEQNGKFLDILLGTLGTSVLENLLGKYVIRAGEGTIIAG